MPNDIFSGIPALDDAAGLEQFVNNTALNDMGVANPAVPAALQTNAEPTTTQEPTQAPADPAAQPAAPVYTNDQVAQIIARNQQLEAQVQAQAQQPKAAPSTPTASPYTPQQVTIIKALIDKGVPIERIQQALNQNPQHNSQQNAIVQRIQNVEQYLQEQQYIAAQNAFIDKMTTFGNKFGLSENDLVTFGNKAMSMGINLTTVTDVESVFRAVYPEQYAIRAQRIASTPTSHIYGGASTPEAPRAATSKLEDAYVDNFLKQAMPNQFNTFPNKH